MIRPIEDLGSAVFDDQRRAYNNRCVRTYECPFCEAEPCSPCFEGGMFSDNRIVLKYVHGQRQWALYESAARYLATVEAISEIMERTARGESWIAARAVIDKAPQMIK